MKSIEEHANSFVIRIWREPREVRGSDPEWRGRIEHVQSGERMYFLSFDKLIEFMTSHLDDWREVNPLLEKRGRGLLGRLVGRLRPRQ